MSSSKIKQYFITGTKQIKIYLVISYYVSLPAYPHSARKILFLMEQRFITFSSEYFALLYPI
jgi:hypothetical protein